jgi:hypothetical protein
VARTACRSLLILVVTRLLSVIRNPSKVPALAGFLTITISGTVLAAALSSATAYAAMGVTRVCPIDDQQKLVAELTGNNSAFVAPGSTVSYVEQVYNPGPETYQEVLTSTQLAPYLTPKQYPAGTQVSHVSDSYILSGQSDVPMHPGQTRTETLTATVGQKASSAGAQLQAWGISETLKSVACNVAQPVIVIIHRVPRGAPHTGDGSMATDVAGHPPRDARHVSVQRRSSAERRARVRHQAADVTREHLTFRLPRAQLGRSVTVTVTFTVAPAPEAAPPARLQRAGHRSQHRA